MHELRYLEQAKIDLLRIKRYIAKERAAARKLPSDTRRNYGNNARSLLVSLVRWEGQDLN